MVFLSCFIIINIFISRKLLNKSSKAEQFKIDPIIYDRKTDSKLLNAVISMANKRNSKLVQILCEPLNEKKLDNNNKNEHIDEVRISNYKEGNKIIMSNYYN